jgi:NAD(P)-dependent dehydrogenase (short-subunit alcohol dehydrogenase family)/acyl carrier protein
LCGGLFSLFHIAKGVAAIQKKNPIKIMAVTTHAMGAEKVFSVHSPQKYPLTVLTRVIQGENRNMTCKHIDFAGDAMVPRDMAKKIVLETKEKSMQKEVVWAGEKRKIRYLDHIRPVPGYDKSAVWQNDKVYLITGGATGIGAAIAENLAQKASPKIVIIGRTELPPKEQWDDAACIAAGSRQDVRIKLMRKLEELGSQVFYYAVDITDKSGINNVISEIKKKAGKINGVFHCAGVKEDKLITEKNWDDYKRILSPKVQGTLVLKECLRNETLEFLVLFSSVSALFGTPGQSDYSAANAFMDGLASVSPENAPVVVSINWPYWQDGGMEMSSAAARKMEAAGLLPLSTAEGFRALEQILAERESGSVAVMKLTENSKFLENQQKPCQLIIENTQNTQNDKCEKDKNSEVKPEAKLKNNEQYLVDMLAQVLELGSDEIDRDLNFREYGLDSLSMKDAMHAIEGYYGIMMDPSVFDEYPTIFSLARYLTENYYDSMPRETLNCRINQEMQEMQEMREIQTGKSLPAEVDYGGRESHDKRVKYRELLRNLFDDESLLDNVRSKIYQIIDDNDHE